MIHKSPDELATISDLVGALQATALAQDPLLAVLKEVGKSLNADVALAVVGRRGWFRVTARVRMKGDVQSGVIDRTWPLPIREGVVGQRIDPLIASELGVQSAYLAYLGTASRAERPGMLLGWAEDPPQLRLVELHARLAGTVLDAHHARRIVRFGRPATTWTGRVASGAPCRPADVAADFLDGILAVLPYEIGAVWATRRRWAGPQLLAASAPTSSTPLSDDRELVARAIAHGRPQWFDPSGGAVSHVAIAVPYATTEGRGAVVVRSLDATRRVMPYEPDVVIGGARDMAVVLSLVESVAIGRQSADPYQWCLELAGTKLACGAEVLDRVATRLIEHAGADLAFVTERVSDRQVMLRWSAADDFDVGSAPIQGHCLLGEVGIAPVLVDCMSGLRVAEERHFETLGVRSYVAVQAGRDLIMGVASRVEAAFDEKVVHWLGAMAAITGNALESIRSQEAAASAEDRLDGVVGATQRLMTAIGHQFRTPLTSIAGFSRMLLGSETIGAPGASAPDASERTEFLEILARQAARLGRIVENFQLAAELELGSWQPVPELVDVDDLTRDVVAEVEVLAAQPGHVILRLDGGRVHVDPGAWRAVVANLADNAVRFGAPPVTVTVRQTQAGLELEVSDHGPGIREKERARVVRLWASEKADAVNPTAGIGLHLVSVFSEQIGGSLELMDTEGGGLTARVVFPNVSGRLALA